MNLNLLQIKEIVTGALRIEECEDGVCFYRFTKEQEELYKNRSDDFYKKTFATSGIALRFFTNSQTLFFRTQITPASSRTYFSFDVLVNGKRVDSLNNFSDITLPQNYTTLKFPLGEFSKEFDLGVGEKEVCICFPWSVKAVLKEIALDDGSFIKPCKPLKKIICFGDSITHGYDALYPSNKYISKLARILDAQEYNKAIGGEIFFPDLAKTKEDFEPDYISVAYGTNDWNCCTRSEFVQNCKAFFHNLTLNYPRVKIFAITPIWRKDYTENRAFGKFDEVDQEIKNIVEPYKNITAVSGYNFVNHDESLYADLRLHPNDEGFEQYFKRLAEKI